MTEEMKDEIKRAALKVREAHIATMDRLPAEAPAVLHATFMNPESDLQSLSTLVNVSLTQVLFLERTKQVPVERLLRDLASSPAYKGTVREVHRLRSIERNTENAPSIAYLLQGVRLYYGGFLAGRQQKRKISKPVNVSDAV